MGVLDHTVEGGSSLTPIVPAPLFLLSNTGRWIGTQSCGVGDAFRPDELWFGSDTYRNYAFIYDLYIDAWLMGCVIRIYMSNWWGEWMAYGGPPFPGTGFPVPAVDNI